MGTRVMAVVVGALALGGGAAAWASLSASPAMPLQAQDAGGATTRPVGNGEQQPARRRVVRISFPWSQLTDLTTRQEAEIREIRREILEKKDELNRQERERILAVLTEAQRDKVAEVEADRARQQAERNERARQNRSTTRPAGDGTDGGAGGSSAADSGDSGAQPG